MRALRLEQLAQQLQAQLKGPADRLITGLASLDSATSEQLSFLSDPRYAVHLQTTRAGAVILHPKQAENFAGAALIMEQPYLGYARASQLFAPPRPQAGYRHPSAVIDSDASLDISVHVGPGAVIESGCEIAAGAVIGAQCYLGKGVKIGSNTLLHPRVTLYAGTQVGQDCILHSGCVIGCDGYGFAPKPQGWEKIAQLGRVIIEDEVEIGANTAIDRGALGNTHLARGVKIDNLVHLAHNVQVGERTLITACVGVAGSTRIGADCMFGGNSGIAGHIEIGDGVQVTGMGMITGSIHEPGVYSSGTGLQPNKEWRKSAVRFRQLDELHQKVRQLEKKLDSLNNKHSEA